MSVDRPEPTLGRGLGRLAWRRKGSLLLGILLGVAVGAAYYFFTPPAYNSSAQILVVKKRPDAVTGTDNSHAASTDDYVASHLALLRSPLIVERAIAQGKLAELPSLARARDLTEEILDKLTVTRGKDAGGGGTNVLTLTFRTPSPRDGNAVLKALIDVYRQEVEKTFTTSTESAVELIGKARDVLQKELAAKEAAYQEFRRKSPLVWKGKDGVNPRQELLDKIEAQRTALLLRQTDLKVKLDALKTAIKNNQSRDVLLALANEAAPKSDAEAARQAQTLKWQEQLLTLLQEEQRLLQRYGPQHPDVKALRQQLATAREFLNRPSAPFGPGKEGPTDPVQWRVQALEQELANIKEGEKMLAELYTREHEEAKKQSGYQVQDETLRNDIARTQLLFDGVVKRLQDAALVKDLGGYEPLVIAAPGSGGVKRVQPSGLVAASLSLLMALLCGIGLVWAAESLDRRLRSADDVRQIGWPVLGRVPAIRRSRSRAAEGTLSTLLVTHAQPDSAAAEAYRALRAVLWFRVQQDRLKVLQVTSPGTGDGKSVLAANLAVLLAQSGQRVLLIDGDFRTPRQHELFGLSAQTGLVSVLEGKARTNDVLCQGVVPGLDVLPAGPPPRNPADLFAAPAFRVELAELREAYDVVLIDTPALLTVTDPSTVASQVDGVLLVLRQGRSTRPQAERAGELLAGVHARLLGVVVNGGRAAW